VFSTNQTGQTCTAARPETHQNLINTRKEQAPANRQEHGTHATAPPGQIACIRNLRLHCETGVRDRGAGVRKR